MEGASEQELWSIDDDDDDVQRHRATDAAGRPTQRALDNDSAHVPSTKNSTTNSITCIHQSRAREQARERMDERERHRVIDVDDRELDIKRSS